jgi:hypothetical protein
MEREKTKIIIFLLTLMLPLSFCFGADERSNPIEVYLMFDNSISMKDNGSEAAAWISEYITDKILQTDDALTIWLAADMPVLEFSGRISSPEIEEEIKTILTSVEFTNSAGNYAAALGELKKNAVSHAEYAHSYIIFVTGMSGQNASLFSAEADVLTYSRSVDFPGWKLMVINLGVEQKIKEAAANYMNSQS